MNPVSEPSDADLTRIVQNAKVVAVVGLSANPERPSYQVAHYLMVNGFTVYGVNPAHSEILGRPCLAFLDEVPEPVDIVDIFRNVEAIPAIVGEAVSIKAKCVWMQQGLAHPEAAAKARTAGLDVVMNRCLKIEHMRLAPRR